MEMGKELKLLSDKLHRVDNGIKQLKIKQEYQMKKLSHQTEAGDNSLVGKAAYLTGKSLQNEQFKQILLEE